MMQYFFEQGIPAGSPFNEDRDFAKAF